MAARAHNVSVGDLMTYHEIGYYKAVPYSEKHPSGSQYVKLENIHGMKDRDAWAKARKMAKERGGNVALVGGGSGPITVSPNATNPALAASYPSLVKPDGPVVKVKNLGWLLKNWKKADNFTWETSGSSGVFRADMRDGSVYSTPFEDFSVFRRFIDRPVFRGLTIYMDGKRYVVGSPEWRELRASHERNPRPAVDEMYQSFHGEPSDETIEISGEEHYHSHVAALGELVELKVKLVGGGTAVIGFEIGDGDVEDNPKKRPVDVDGNPVPQNYEMLSIRRNQSDALDVKKGLAVENIPSVIVEPPTTTFGASTGNWSVWTPKKTYKRAVKLAEKAYFDRYPDRLQYGKKVNPGFWPFNSFTKTEIYHVGSGDKFTQVARQKGYTIYRDNKTGQFAVPALERESRFDTAKDAARFIENWTKVRKNPGTDFSLYNAAMKADDAFQSALEKEYGKRAGDIRYQSSKHPAHIKKLAKIKHEADEKWLNEMRKKNPRGDSSGPVYLTSNEDGSQLHIVGGDQSLDLSGIGITGQSANKELITIGSVTNICYHAHKIFDGKREEFDYVHKFS